MKHRRFRNPLQTEVYCYFREHQIDPPALPDPLVLDNAYIVGFLNPQVRQRWRATTLAFAAWTAGVDDRHAAETARAQRRGGKRA